MRAAFPPSTSASTAPRSPSPAGSPRAGSGASGSQPAVVDPPGPSSPGAEASGPAAPAWRDERLPVAGYLMNRRRRFGPVSEADLALLLRAQDAVDRARAQVPHGRGNVTTDFVATAGTSAVRTMAVQHELSPHEAAPEGIPPAVWSLGAAAVNATYMGAAQCYELTALVICDLALTIEPGRQVQAMSSQQVNHTWPELQAVLPADAASSATTRVVADAWAEGPAVLASDATWSGLPDRRVDLTIGPDNRRALNEAEMSQHIQLLDADSPDEIEADLRRRMARAGMEITLPEFEPQPVLSNFALQEGRMMFDLNLPDRAHLARQRQANHGDAPVRWAQLSTVDELSTYARARAVEGRADALGVPPLSGEAVSADPLRPIRNGIAAFGVARSLGADIRQAMALRAPIELSARQLRIAQRMPALLAPLEQRQQTAQDLQRRVAELQAAQVQAAQVQAAQVQAAQGQGPVES